jgi:hypothetical protein
MWKQYRWDEFSLFYVCFFYEGAWLREDNRLRVFENRMLRGYLGPRQRK